MHGKRGVIMLSELFLQCCLQGGRFLGRPSRMGFGGDRSCFPPLLEVALEGSFGDSKHSENVGTALSCIDSSKGSFSQIG